MFENLRNITIEGGYFEQPTTLTLFKEKQPLSIIYGRNGSGKTTIAKAIRQFIGKDVEQPNEEGYVLYSVSTDASILDDKKGSIFIFDEEFVRENVRTKGNGLETIVMMGEQIELDSQITRKNEEKITIEKKIEEQIILQANFENEKDISSPKYFFDKIRDRLREDGGWADIDRDVKGNSVKSRVTDDLINRLVSIEEPVKTEEELKAQLNADMALYMKSKNAQTIVWEPSKIILPETLNEIKALLERQIENPVLSEREHRLLAFLQKHSEYNSVETTRQMAEEKWPFCPLCLREVGEKDYQDISEILRLILNKESEAYSEELDKAMNVFADITTALPIFPDKLNEKEYTAAQLAIEILNKDVAAIRSKIVQRKRNLYGVMPEAFNDEI